MAKSAPEALELIKRFEGYHRRLPDGRVAPYLCPANVWTIGYGSTRDGRGAPVTRDTSPITEAEADALFRRDVASFEASVARMVKTQLNDNQFGALTSFAYNLGAGRLQSSTLLKRVNEGRIAEAADEFLKWVMAGGRRLNGLALRREAERALFLKPVESEPSQEPLGTAGIATETSVLGRFMASFRAAFSGAR